jgi:hypothetical protein
MGRPPAVALQSGFEHEVARKLGDFNSLSNTLWALASMGRPPTAELQARLEHEVARKLGDFNAQGLSNTLWALAKMGRPPTAELQARLEHEVARKLGDFNALSNTLWALASMGRPPTAELHARLEKEVARKLGDLNEVEVQQVLRAYILLEHVPSGQVLAFARRPRWRVEPGRYSATRVEPDNPSTPSTPEQHKNASSPTCGGRPCCCSSCTRASTGARRAKHARHVA